MDSMDPVHLSFASSNTPRSFCRGTEGAAQHNTYQKARRLRKWAAWKAPEVHFIGLLALSVVVVD